MVNGTPGDFLEAIDAFDKEILSSYIFVPVIEFLSIHLELEIASGNIHAIKKSHVTYVSHLLFAGDLLIFARADKMSFTYIDKILQFMALNTGLKVNKDKSKIFFGKSCHNIEGLKNLLEIQVGALPSKYLGIPSDLSPLIDKCKSRMDGWSPHTLSFTGRVQLVKSVIHGYLKLVAVLQFSTLLSAV